MSQVQSIIVYRNPAEAMLWESGMVWPLLVACFVAFSSFLVTYKLCELVMKPPRYGQSQKSANTMVMISGASAVFWAILTLNYIGAV